MTPVDRYVFVPMVDSGLLLDLESGELFQLNATAAFVWGQFLDGHAIDAIASTLANRHGLDAAQTKADVQLALAPTGLSEAPAFQDYEFRRTSEGYEQLYRGVPALDLDTAGTDLVLKLPASERRPGRIRNCLRAIVPKILSLRGHTVLHASAVLARGRLLAFSGRSGAGKTTTARALVERGATLVSEDKLLIDATSGGTVAWCDGEPHMEAWVSKATASILVDERVSCSELDSAARGNRVPLAEIAFVDVAARAGDELVARALSAADTAAATFRGMFLGTERVIRWRHHLETAVALADHVSGYAVTMPEGLAALGRAAEKLSRRGTLSREKPAPERG